MVRRFFSYENGRTYEVGQVAYDAFHPDVFATILLMALDAGPLTQGPFKEWCKRFANLAAAHEREACAKFFESTLPNALPNQSTLHYAELLAGIAAAIRARGNT